MYASDESSSSSLSAAPPQQVRRRRNSHSPAPGTGGLRPAVAPEEVAEATMEDEDVDAMEGEWYSPDYAESLRQRRTEAEMEIAVSRDGKALLLLCGIGLVFAVPSIDFLEELSFGALTAEERREGEALLTSPSVASGSTV